jgi:mono/diheme cytochrome c family protein
VAPAKFWVTRRWTRGLLAAIVVVLLLALSAAAAIELRWRRTFDAPYPEIAARDEPAVVARGEYLVFGPATCAYCHVPREQWTELERGARPPLSGNHVFRLPFGEFYSPTLTPDAETGIGRRSDGELARILRYGVRADGRAAFPFMTFHEMTDEDLVAVLSFLRTRPAVRMPVPEHSLTLLGKALMAFAIEPVAPVRPPARHSPRAPSVARGEYLANVVSSCAECHTNRSSRDGSRVGPKFAGGQRLDVAADPTRVFVPPNLTPEPRTSPIGRWTEDEFVARFQQGSGIEGTPMPWGAFARMVPDDLRSVYRYLRTLPPVEHDTGPVIQDKRPHRSGRVTRCPTPALFAQNSHARQVSTE